MKITINGRPEEVAPGTRLRNLVDRLEERVRRDPMIIALIAKTGKSQMLYILNGTVVPAAEIDRIELQEGDDVRYVHPFFGG